MTPIPHLADSHFHSLAMAERGLPVVRILQDFRSHSIAPLLDVAIQPEDTTQQKALTRDVGEIYYSSGLHPSRTGREDWASALSLVREQIVSGGFAAVGETGLDWFRLYAPRERQIELFDEHLRIAREHRLPVIVHNRQADIDTADRLRRAALTVPGIMHCFSSGPEMVDTFLDLGMYISFAGNMTFKNAEPLRLALTRVPIDRLLIETDAPFLAPHPHRGQDNHPGLLVHTAQRAAEVRGMSVEDIAYRTAENLHRVLQIA